MLQYEINTGSVPFMMKKLENILYLIAFIGLGLWFAYSKGWILTNFESIDAQTAIQILETDNNISLLDVRTIAEYKEGHLQDATLIPLQVLAQNLSKLASKKKHKIIVYCRSGNRSITASRILEKHGFTPLNVKGGILALRKAHVTIVK